jgi:hypothetical protein
MVNRVQFLRQHQGTPHYQSVNITRATLCELIAIRILRRYNEDNPGPQGLLLLANILVAGFDPFQGCPDDVREENELMRWKLQKKDGDEKKLPALEIAIISKSKGFLSSSASQMVVTAIYEGRVVYTPSSFIDILPDRYKRKPICLYDPRKAPLLNQYRLIVPRTRNYLEVGQFLVLIGLYVMVMRDRDPPASSSTEIVFAIYAAGWTLDIFASILEHGWQVFTQNLWSFLDVTFIFIYIIYAILRINGVWTGDTGSSRQAMDVLAVGAPILVPRLAFNVMSENMLFLSLRAMMSDFISLTFLAAWCFGGFLLSMVWLSNGGHTPLTISKWMLWIWFGLDGTGIQESVALHHYLGPTLMVAFAFLGNTLFLTILVSMLTNTFAGIVANSNAEVQYRRAVLTLEGVKSDAIFAYQPPFNILALMIMIPLKAVVTPRWFHKINVAAVRTLNAPLLLVIGYLERRILWARERRKSEGPGLTRSASRTGLLSLSRGFSAHADIHAVFEAEPEQEEEEEEDDMVIGSSSDDGGGNGSYGPLTMGPQVSLKGTGSKRRDSIAPFGAAIKDQMRDMLDDVQSRDAGSEVGTRLDRMEELIRRIEMLLNKVCENLDGGGDRKVAKDVKTQETDQ